VLLWQFSNALKVQTSQKEAFRLTVFLCWKIAPLLLSQWNLKQDIESEARSSSIFVNLYVRVPQFLMTRETRESTYFFMNV
jgi:hypothetical protein